MRMIDCSCTLATKYPYYIEVAIYDIHCAGQACCIASARISAGPFSEYRDCLWFPDDFVWNAFCRLDTRRLKPETQTTTTITTTASAEQ